jgi:serine/threonine protein kinase
MIGKYLVVGRFPQSGQAQVFRVVHPKLRRDLVLKLANQPIDADGRSAVVVEGQRLAELEHPNIVRIHDLDFYEGRPYLVMEFVQGRTLAQYAREQPVNPRQAATLVAEIAGAVAFAHRRGVVHQDIKPANVLIDETGRPRLIDFGLAWQQDAWSDATTPSEGGTFAYMAPEQARTDLNRIRPLSDIFALGGLLYFLLTGKGPFETDSHEESWDRARRCDLDRSALENADVPRRLKAICLKALEANPRSRFESADAMRRALERPSLIQRPMVMLGAIAVPLTLLVSALMFWPRRETTSREGAIEGQAVVEPTSRPGPTHQADLRVTRFEIPHFPKLDANHFDPSRVGILGRNSFSAREDDEVTVRTELSEPAYVFLIAFRPNGTDELCDPDDEDTLPPLKRQPLYPPPEKSDERYRLSEGCGLCAFALVVSRAPLPSYREWKRRIGPLPWGANLSCEPGVVWLHDHQGLQPLLAEDLAGTRGKGIKARGSGEPAARLALWLRRLPGIDAVTLEAFPIEPATAPR